MTSRMSMTFVRPVTRSTISESSRDGFVHALEDSSKRAGDDLFRVSGNWEFGAEESRIHKVRRRSGTIPNFQERRNCAKGVGWVKNEGWHRAVKEYSGHESRAACKLLGYEPRYRGYYKRVGQAQEDSEGSGSDGAEVNQGVTVAVPGSSIPFVAEAPHRVESGAQASTAEQDPPETLVRRKRVAHRSPRTGPVAGEMSRNLELEDLTATVLGEGMGETLPMPGEGAAPEHNVIQLDAEEGIPAPIPSPNRPPSREVQTPSSEARRREIRSRKRPREEIPSWRAESPHAEPAPWEPSFRLVPDMPPVTVKDSVRRKPTSHTLEALGRACTLPEDVAFFRGLDDYGLLWSLVQSSLLTVSKSMMVVDRFYDRSQLISELDERRQKLEEASEADAQKISALERLKSEYEDKLKEAGVEVEAGKKKIAELGTSLAGAEAKLKGAEIKVEIGKKKVAELGTSLREADGRFEAQKKRVDDAKANKLEDMDG